MAWRVQGSLSGQVTHLHSFRKFLHVSGQSDVNKSTTISPLLVSSSTDMITSDRCYWDLCLCVYA